MLYCDTLQVRGFSTSFVEGGALPLSDWDRSFADNQEGIWLAVLSDPSLAIVDASLAQDTYTTGRLNSIRPRFRNRFLH